MPIKFLYFDLGKVLVNFDIERMLEQMADVAGIHANEVRRVLFPPPHASVPRAPRPPRWFCGALP